MKFTNAHALNIVTLEQHFGCELTSADFDIEVEGVYCITTGSRGEVEGIEFVGEGLEFEPVDHTDYEGQMDDAAEDGELDSDDIEDFEYNTEFTSCAWDSDVYVCGISEEAADHYFYYSPKTIAGGWTYDGPEVEDRKPNSLEMTVSNKQAIDAMRTLHLYYSQPAWALPPSMNQQLTKSFIDIVKENPYEC